jgi:hypothetical protein
VGRPYDLLVTNDASPSEQDLHELQEATLAAMLERRALPGRQEPLQFPDLQVLTRGGEVLVADENLAGPLEDVGQHEIRVVSSAEIENDRAFLRFGPPEVDGDEVAFRVEALVASEPGGAALGLGGVVLRFRRSGEGWEADAPALYAT